MYAAVSQLDSLSNSNKNLITEVLSDLTTKCIQMASSPGIDQKQKNTIKIILYFFLVLCSKIELVAKKANEKTADNITVPKNKGRGKKTKKNLLDDDEDEDDSTIAFSLPFWRPKLLMTVQQVINIDSSLIWTMGIVHESFLMLLTKLPIQILEGEGSAPEVSLKAMCINSIVQFSGRYTGSCNYLLTSFIDALCRCEHMGAVVSNILKQTNGLLAAELMAEIGHMNMSEVAKSGNGVKNIGVFLVSFAEACPSLVAQYLPSIMHQIDSDVYQIRSAILQAIGVVVAYIHSTQDSSVPAADNDASSEEDVEDKQRNTEYLNRVRETMLDVMVERTYDNNAFTRAAGIKVWSSLVESGSVPVRRIGYVAEIAVDRMADRTAAVRKAALNLLTILIECNPFNANLDITIFRKRAKELAKGFEARVKALKELIQGPNDEGVGSDFMEKIEEEDGEDENDEAIAQKKAEAEIENDEFMASEDVVSDPEIVAIVAEKEYCNSALKLLEAVESAISRVEEMTKSKTVSDVIEAIGFFARAVNFNIQGAGKSFRDAFALIWHHDETIRAECIASFKNVFLTDGASSDAKSLPPSEIATNLAGLVARCGMSELASMEKIVGELFKADLDNSVVQAIWTKILALFREEAPTAMQSKTIGGLLKVVSIIAQCCPGVMTAPKIRLVTQVATAEVKKSAPDYNLISAAAQCIQTAPPFLENPTKKDTIIDEEMKQSLLEAAPCLRDIILGFWCPDTEIDTRNWFEACENALHSLFHTHPSPDKVLSSILVPLYADLASTLSSSDGRATASSAKLARVLFVLGQGAITSLVFTEKIAGFAKKRNEEIQRTECRDNEKKNKTHQNVSDAMEEEMGLVAAADAEHDRIYHNVIEKQLVSDNILGKFHPLIAFIVANENGTFSNALLRETALLALCRFMSVSSELCEVYLPLLFTIVEREKSEKVRTTVMIAIGDLAFRFPNSLEPWTANMYARLSDESVLVRYNTLMTLTHLILNDMIKVKGQVAHMVLCLVDKNQKVCDLACLFFTELSKRSNNPVYNLLSDIISILSRSSLPPATTITTTTDDNGDTASEPVIDGVGGNNKHDNLRILSEQEFKDTMSFLLKFVGKDKQADSLLERLLVRIGLATDITQKRNLAFCISQLPITEKGVKKMIEMIKLFKDALYDTEVFECFKQCLSKAKKSNLNPFGRKPTDASSSSGDAGAGSTSASGDVATSEGNCSTNASMKSVSEEFEHIMSIIKDAAEGNNTQEIDFDSIIATATKNHVNGGKERDENTKDDANKKSRAAAAKKSSAAMKKKTAAKKKASSKKIQYSDDEEDDESDFYDEADMEEEVEVLVAKKSSRSRQPLKAI